MAEVKKGQVVWSRGRVSRGVATGKWHHCRLTGCTGARLAVRWDDGSCTFPCTKGMRFNTDGSHEII